MVVLTGPGFSLWSHRPRTGDLLQINMQEVWIERPCRNDRPALPDKQRPCGDYKSDMQRNGQSSTIDLWGLQIFLA